MAHTCDGSACVQAKASLREAWERDDLRTGAALALRSVEEFPDCPDVLALSTHFLAWTGRFDAALDAAQSALAGDEGSALAWAALADAHSITGLADNAVECIERALAIDSDDPWVLEKALSAYMGQPEKMVGAARTWRDGHPEDPRACGELAAMLQASGEFDAAMELVDEGLQRSPDAPSLLRRKARHYIRQQMLPQAVDLFRRASEGMPGNPFAKGEYACYLAHAQRFDDAEQQAKMALEISPCSVMACTALALVAESRGNEREAREWRERAAVAIPALRDNKPMGEIIRAMKENRWPRVVQVSAQLRTEAVLKVTRDFAAQWQADALLQLGRNDECRTILQELATAGIKSPNLALTWSALHEKDGNAAEAVSVLEQGMQDFPSAGQIRALLLRLFARLGQKEKGDRLAQELVNNPPAFIPGVAQAYMDLDGAGYHQHAEVLLAQGMRQFPDSEDLKVLEASARLDRGDFAGARAMLRDLKGQHRGLARQMSPAALALLFVKLLLKKAIARLTGRQGPGKA